jgi:hypothetical protein
MSVHFCKESISAQPDTGYYSPEKLTLLKRIFDSACKEAGIADKAIWDDLANKLLVAGKTFVDEDRLIEFMKKAIVHLRL